MTRLSPPPRPLDLIRWPEAALWCIVGLAAGWLLAILVLCIGGFAMLVWG